MRITNLFLRLCAALVPALGLLLVAWTVARSDSLLQYWKARVDEDRRGRELDEVLRVNWAKQMRKYEIARAVSAGRMRLLEAAAHFHALNSQSPRFIWPLYRQGTEGGSDEERHCREVLNWVSGELSLDDPCVHEAVCARLEQELQDSLKHGPLRLPDVRMPLAVAPAVLYE